MLLKDVLKLLGDHIETHGYRRTDQYLLIFGGITDQVDYNIDDTVKQKYSGARGLDEETTRSIASPDGIAALAQNLENRYLPVAGNHAGLYEGLSALLETCPCTNPAQKEEILAACDPNDTAELARMIAACIAIGNYNTRELLASKKRMPRIGSQSMFNTKYMCLDRSAAELSIARELWNASKREFFAAKEEGRRFHGQTILERLLPHGFEARQSFLSRGRLEDGKAAPLTRLCAAAKEDIAIIGVGGIGKTTFLQKLLCDEFLTESGSQRRHRTGRPVPFFIELNRCPKTIAAWYDETLKKTNFITRYIGQLWENHSSLDSVSPATLNAVEKELQRTPADGSPQYLLLLDGFNEVHTAPGVRAALSREITALHRYPNVRIITASRETQAAYYAADFKNIYLVGLEDGDILSHLTSCGFSEPAIGEIMACPPLVECLRIPLYLCMFSAGTADGFHDFLPETAGEILYCFFHRQSAFYNARSRAKDTFTNPLDERETAVVLDFLLPYVGWRFEEADAFSMSETDLLDVIRDAMAQTRSMFLIRPSNPFRDFDYSGRELEAALCSLCGPDGSPRTDAILSCMFDYLGIVCRYQASGGAFSERVRYSFCHHHFRDYFSAMWEVQLLSMLQCMSADDFTDRYPWFLNRIFWQSQKTAFISQILMEHRNRPRLNPVTENWELPPKKWDEQRVLTHAVDYCRRLCKKPGMDIHYFLRNVLSAVLYGRKEYSGMDFSDLDLRGISLFHAACSRRGRTGTLAARFDGAVLTGKNFAPEEHRELVMEYVYNGRNCFTLDMSGRIKCWDVCSGKLEYEFKALPPIGLYDFTRKGYIKVSKNGN